MLALTVLMTESSWFKSSKARERRARHAFFRLRYTGISAHYLVIYSCHTYQASCLPPLHDVER